MMTQHVDAHGHEHVRGTHKSTLELTTDDWLTPAGDCIIGINASHAAAKFDTEFVEAARNSNTEIICALAAGGHRTEISGWGDPDLTFLDDRSLVIRTSSYVDDRTVMVEANGAARDVPRPLIQALQDGSNLTCTFSLLP